jgi:hypothetical protein
MLQGGHEGRRREQNEPVLAARFSSVRQTDLAGFHLQNVD